MSASAIDRVKELLAAAIEDDDGLMRLLPFAIPIAQALVDSQEALEEIGHGENTSYLACPGPPHCDKSHYPTCPVQIARAALRLDGLAKAMK